MEPSEWEHGAPWNEGEDGECACIQCRKKVRDEAQSERDIDRYDEGREFFLETQQTDCWDAKAASFFGLACSVGWVKEY